MAPDAPDMPIMIRCMTTPILCFDNHHGRRPQRININCRYTSVRGLPLHLPRNDPTFYLSQEQTKQIANHGDHD